MLIKFKGKTNGISYSSYTTIIESISNAISKLEWSSTANKFSIKLLSCCYPAIQFSILLAFSIKSTGFYKQIKRKHPLVNDVLAIIIRKFWAIKIEPWFTSLKQLNQLFKLKLIKKYINYTASNKLISLEKVSNWLPNRQWRNQRAFMLK